MHDYWMFTTIALILAGILSNRQDAKELRAEIAQLRAEMHQMRDEIYREFREFYRTLGQHDARINALEKKP